MVNLDFKNMYNICMLNGTLIITKLAKYLILPILAFFSGLWSLFGAPRVQLWEANCTGHAHKCSNFVRNYKQ